MKTFFKQSASSTRYPLSLLNLTRCFLLFILIGWGCKKDEKNSIIAEVPVPTSSSQNNKITWVSTVNWDICESTEGSPILKYITNTSDDDYKPTYSPDGKRIAFFRVEKYGVPAGDVNYWKTKICVINVDGTGFKELTDATYANYNPMWTRDGSNKITFTRNMLATKGHPWINVYMVDPDGEKGNEKLISDSTYPYFAYSSLKDGRIFVRKEFWNEYYLMTIGKNGQSKFQQISYPESKTYLHKMSISPSETKITYMKKISRPDEYKGSVLAYADFDKTNLTISNEVIFTQLDTTTIDWYPCWTPDEMKIVYITSPGTWTKAVVKAYNIIDKTTSKISVNDSLNHIYPNVKNVVK